MVQYLTLGYDCSPAAALRNLGLRDAALPFDWVVSSVDAIALCFAEDFARFHCDLRFNDTRTRLIDAYGFEFPHDYPREEEQRTDIGEGVIGEEAGRPITDQWRDHYPIVYEKYKRRVERMRAILTGSESIIVLCRYYPHEVIRLYEVIRQRCPRVEIHVINSCVQPYSDQWITTIYTERDGEWNDTRVWRQAISETVSALGALSEVK